MKYYIGNRGHVPGPGGKELNFSTDLKPASVEDINKLLDEFFSASKMSDEEKKKLNEKAWTVLNKGSFVSIEDKVIQGRKK